MGHTHKRHERKKSWGEGFIVRGSKDETGQWGMRKRGKEGERRGGDKRKETRGNEVGRYSKIHTHV